MKREEQLIENTWKLEDIYPTEDLFDQDKDTLNQLIEQIKTYKGHLDQVESILEMLHTQEKIEETAGRMLVYSKQRSNQDMANSKYQKMYAEVCTYLIRLSEACSYINVEVIENSDYIYAHMDELKEYKRYLEVILNNKDHVLDQKSEALLARAGDLMNAENIFSMFNDADIRFEDCLDQNGNSRPVTQSLLMAYLMGKDRVLRKNAFESYYKEYAKYNNTLAAMYIANIKQTRFMAIEHKFNSSLEASLFSNEIPVSFYENLIHSIHTHLPSLHRYMSLRKKILKVDELHLYDTYVDLANTPETIYSFEEGKKIVLEGLKLLGKDYTDKIQEGFDNRWIDVYENEGKSTGAYSWGCYGVHPYVLMNYNGTLNDVFTIAHEMGHSMHTYYSNSNQSILNSGYTLFVAEVASTCNESLLIHDLLSKSTDQEEKKYLITYFLDQVRGTIYRQALFAEFEEITHGLYGKGEMLDSERLNKIYLDLICKYYGEDLIPDPQIQYEWSRIPHYYSPFYVYQYATGLSAALAISKKIINKEENALENYIQFLSSGCLYDPITLLKIAGVDMSKSDAVDSALEMFDEYLDQLEELI